MKVDLHVETPVSRSARVKQLEAMFDVPPAKKARLEWRGDLPIENEDWNVGLIVGPSGSGKSTILNQLFRKPTRFKWKSAAVIDDFAGGTPMEEISRVCQAVGFNTIPAWMRPFKVLSNGEQFRVEMARRLLEDAAPIVVDEFTSVVDRQVAQIGAHAVQKYVRRAGKQLVAASCHYDVIDWLQPDWIFEPGTMAFRRRRLRRRPELSVAISYVPIGAWELFAPFHYMTAKLSRQAKCFGLFVDGRIASIAAMLHRPHPRTNDIMGCSRLVTLPDWQGLGLAMILIERVGAAYRAIGKRVRTYPAHPALIRAFDQSPTWRIKKKPGDWSPLRGKTSSLSGGKMGGRPCATFEYAGPAGDAYDARRLIYRNPKPKP